MGKQGGGWRQTPENGHFFQGKIGWQAPGVQSPKLTLPGGVPAMDRHPRAQGTSPGLAKRCLYQSSFPLRPALVAGDRTPPPRLLVQPGVVLGGHTEIALLDVCRLSVWLLSPEGGGHCKCPFGLWRWKTIPVGTCRSGQMLYGLHIYLCKCRVIS